MLGNYTPMKLSIRAIAVFALLILFNAVVRAEENSRTLADARSLLARKLYQPAIEILEKEVAKDPAEKEAITLYADALWSAKMWEKSLPWLERAAAESDPREAPAWQLLRARSLSYLGRFSESLREYATLGDEVLWERLVVALAAEQREEVYVALGKLAAMTQGKETEYKTVSRIKRQLSLYESAVANGKEAGKAFAIGLIDEWKKQ
jgi:tetratricopeptide (TPR) repeat protein